MCSLMFSTSIPPPSQHHHHQFQVMASDRGTPEKTTLTSIYIRVQRDLRRPTFESAPYVTTVRESQPVDSSVFQLRGRDDDVMVRTCFQNSVEAKKSRRIAQVLKILSCVVANIN